MDNRIHTVAFDLDGTLLNNNKKISETDQITLKELGQKGILRVAATGRNIHSVYRVIPIGFPVDYVVFSSGAGIMNWKTGEMLFTCHLSPVEINEILEIINPHQLSFTIHHPIPDTHIMMFNSNGQTEDDLFQYANYYHPIINAFNPANINQKSTQMIIQFHQNNNLFNQLSNKLDFVKIVRTTSPINHSSIWMEVFNRQVSKANGLKWLCTFLKRDERKIMSIGNDFNDYDMLDFTAESFVVANAPAELRDKFSVTSSNNENGFTEAIKTVFG
jgi:Cof subfamily protein (haloacid dehalogenase superfamily)